MTSVERWRTTDLGASDVRAIRALLDAAFDGRFDAHDWEHCTGGVHLLVRVDGVPAAHAAVVPRALDVDGVPWRTGYVEGVATLPAHQGRGLGTAIVGAATQDVRASYELGALSTGLAPFYERLGWERWAGRTWVRDGRDLVRTPDEDDGVLVLRHGPSAGLELTGDIACERRPGDDW